jgi:guanine deaminase
MEQTDIIRQEFMKRAAELAGFAVENDLGGPFGAVVVKDGIVIGEGYNRVTSSNDPTAHAEIMAIRDACRRLGHFQLEGCEIYSSCEPCPMCMGAIYWARPEKVYYGSGRHDAALAGFDDEFIYTELANLPGDRKILMVCLPEDTAIQAFRMWNVKENKKEY